MHVCSFISLVFPTNNSEKALTNRSRCPFFSLKFHEMPTDYDKQREFRKRKGKRLKHNMVSTLKLKVNQGSPIAVNSVPIIVIPRQHTSV
jgi:hypothetical protein